jgi:hypothetical protein
MELVSGSLQSILIGISMRLWLLILAFPVLAAPQGRGGGPGAQGGRIQPPAGQTSGAPVGAGPSQGATSGRGAASGSSTGALTDLPAQQPSKAEDLGSVAGQVSNANTGEPLGKAELTLRRTDMRPGMGGIPGSYSGTTDSTGRFLIQKVEPGRYRLTARRNGYVAGEYGAADPSRAGNPITVDRAQKLAAINVRLSPHGVITGRITDPDGDAMLGVQVQAYRYRYVQGRRQLAAQAGASTNDLGEYRIYGLPPGKYYLAASYRAAGQGGGPGGGQGGRGGMGPGGQAQSADAAEGWAPSYYPGVYDPGSASVLDVLAGSELSHINLRLAKVRTYRVRGQVTSDVAAGGRGMSVSLTSRSEIARDAARNARVDQQGAFEISNVLPGIYTLTASSMGSGNSAYARREVAVSGSDVDGIKLRIPAPVEISGNVTFEDASGAPTLTGMQVRLQLRDAAGSGPALRTGGGPGGAGSAANAVARVSSDGSFKLTNVVPDAYLVSVSNTPQGYYVKSVRVGRADALASGFEISGATSIQVELHANAGTVSGLVLNPETVKAAVSATVALVPQEPERAGLSAFYKTGSTDQYGQFTMQNVSPGEYKLFAWDVVESGAYMDPEFIRPLASQGQSVSIREGSQQTVQITMILSESAAGEDAR